MLEINEVLYRKQEDTDQVAINIAQALKVEDIQVFHRLSPDANAGIIGKFTSRRKREEKKKCLIKGNTYEDYNEISWIE